jgi:hypothetical protein
MLEAVILTAAICRRKSIGDELTTRLELTLELRLEFLSPHLDGVHARMAQGEEKAGGERSGLCLPLDLDRGAQAAVLEGDPQVGGFCIVQWRDRIGSWFGLARVAEDG